MGHEKVTDALEANKAHQAALAGYIERLQAEFDTVDGLLAIAAIDSDASSDSEPESDVRVQVPGAGKPTSLLLPRELLAEGGPFSADARWKRRYDELTSTNPMKFREHEALREAVRAENRRLHALRSELGVSQDGDDLSKHPPEFFEQNMDGLDFRRIAIKMNDMIPGGVKRTATECEVRWRGHLHPSFNHGPWSPDETTRLHGLVAEVNDKGVRPDWVKIAKDLGTGRTPIDCMRRATTRRAHTWTKAADRALKEAVDVYGQNNWQLVAMHVSEDATAHQCQKRYGETVDPSVRGGPWTAEEDDRLRRAIAAFSSDGAHATESPAPGTTVEPEAVAEAEADTCAKEAAQGAGTKGKGKAKDNTKDKGKSKAKEKVQVSWQDVALFVPGRTNNQCRERYERVLLRGGEPPKARAGGRRKGGEENAQVKTKLNGSKDRTKGKKGLPAPTPDTAQPIPQLESEQTSQAEVSGSRAPLRRKAPVATAAPEPAPPRPQPRPRPRRKAPAENIRPLDAEADLERNTATPANSSTPTSQPAPPNPLPPSNSAGPPSPEPTPAPAPARTPTTPRTRARAQPRPRPRRRAAGAAAADTRKRKRTFATESSSEGEGEGVGASSAPAPVTTPAASTFSKAANASVVEDSLSGPGVPGVRRSSRLASATGRG